MAMEMSNQKAVEEIYLNNTGSINISGNISDLYYNDFTSVRNGIMATSQSLLPKAVPIEKYMNGYTAIIIIILGLVGNTLTVIVLNRRTMHSSTNCYLLALAIWDALVLIGTLLLVTLPELIDGFKELIFPYIVVYIYPFALTAHMATLWLTVSFTVERYIAVCHPLKAARMCTIARARFVIIAVSVISILFNLSRWFEYKIEINKNNTTVGQTNFGKDPLYIKVYFLWLYLFIMFFIPLTSLAILNTFLIIAVKQSKQQRKDMNVRQSRENNVTIMLISVVIVFMICQVPALIYNIAWAIDITLVKSNDGWKTLSAFRNFMVTLNSCVNFILYCAIGQKFRRTFMRTFCYHFIKNEDINSFNFPHSSVLASSTMVNYSKYRVRRDKKGVLHFKMADMSGGSAVTNVSVLSKYSPHRSRESSPLQTTTGAATKQNGTCTNHDNGIKDAYESEEDQEMCSMLNK